jgi:hypothetical protein
MVRTAITQLRDSSLFSNDHRHSGYQEGGIRMSTYLLATSDALKDALFYQRF